MSARVEANILQHAVVHGPSAAACAQLVGIPAAISSNGRTAAPFPDPAAASRGMTLGVGYTYPLGSKATRSGIEGPQGCVAATRGQW